MEETFIYDFFKQILVHSKTIQGRFVVVDGSPGDISSANFGKLVNDSLGIYEKKKYPAALMFPPVEISPIRANSTNLFCIDIAFCDLNERGVDTIKSLNPVLNVSYKTPLNDWENMRRCAGDFIKALKFLVKKNKALASKIRVADKDIVFRRFSLHGSEALNGVRMTFYLSVADTCEIEDYDTSNLNYGS